MWFAAMSNYTEEPWFVNFVAKLLQGDRDTLSLLRFNPFASAPPKYVRARLYPLSLQHRRRAETNRGMVAAGI